jgi:hypothetical protein
MTHDERLAERDRKLAEQEQRRQERLRKSRNKVTETRRERRSIAETQLALRRKRTGLYAETVGLFVWDEATVAQLLTLLAQRLAHVPDPASVLDALLRDTAAASVGRIPLQESSHGVTQRPPEQEKPVQNAVGREEARYVTTGGMAQ